MTQLSLAPYRANTHLSDPSDCEQSSRMVDSQQRIHCSENRFFSRSPSLRLPQNPKAQGPRGWAIPAGLALFANDVNMLVMYCIRTYGSREPSSDAAAHGIESPNSHIRRSRSLSAPLQGFGELFRGQRCVDVAACPAVNGKRRSYNNPKEPP